MRITARRNPAAVEQEARKVLADTDWYVLRFIEEKTPIPADVRKSRAKARAALRKKDAKP